MTQSHQAIQFDQLHRYIFKDYNVRGELVQLKDSYSQIIETGDYPNVIANLLGELMCATSLLTATLKFEGEISVQLQSKGVIKYIAINGTHEQNLRGTARWDGELSTSNLQQLLPNGLLVITISPKEGERYQGVVSLNCNTLAECLENYFTQSEQLETCIILHCDPQQQVAGGMLLQVLPKEVDAAQRDFQHLKVLTSSVTKQELLSIDANELLFRLYHEETVELFSPSPVAFVCGCSKERSGNALRAVSYSELMDIIESDGVIKLNCQYCNAIYEFNADDINALHHKI